MKLLEFLETIREDASNEPGTFVGARLTRDSERAITRWMRDNGLRKKEPQARFHITVIGDPDQSFDWYPATFDPPLEVDPSSYKLKKFDEGAIVLTFSVPELERRHEAGIKKHGITWKHPTYSPHLTLSYDPTELNTMERLLTPTFPIYVQNEYVQSWGFTESADRRRKVRTDESILMERNVLNVNQVDSWVEDIIKRRLTFGFGAETRDIIHDWARKALRKYILNDVPAPQITDFRVDPNSYPDPGKQLVGKASMTWPNDPGTFGVLSGRSQTKPLHVPQWLPDALERGDSVFVVDDRFISSHEGSFATVRDWFRHLMRNEPERLNPGRLNRMSWEQAEQAAFQWHDAMKAAELDNTEEREEDREIYMDMGNGIAWWKLTGQSCLDREGNLMGHCVADYVGEVESGQSIILSLRDAKNLPHVTVELSKNLPWAKNKNDKPEATYEIEQVKGKENKAPVEKYWPYVDALIKKLGADKPIGVQGEGEKDLRECEIEMYGDMLIRTKPSLDDVNCVLSMVQYPGDREWSVYDNEEMEVWEALRNLEDRDVIPEADDYFTQGIEIVQYIKWLLISKGEWSLDTQTDVDTQFLHDNSDYDVDPDKPVPTSINIKVPDIEYDILSGSPDGYQLDVKHALASRGALT